MAVAVKYVCTQDSWLCLIGRTKKDAAIIGRFRPWQALRNLNYMPRLFGAY